MADIIGDFTRGPGVTVLYIGDLPKPSPLILLKEAIFPGEVADENDRPDWLVNVTNDALVWADCRSAPAFRNRPASAPSRKACRSCAPLIPVFPATVDPLGRIVGLRRWQEGVLDIILPAPLHKLTLYARFGDTVFFRRWRQQNFRRSVKTVSG